MVFSQFRNDDTSAHVMYKPQKVKMVNSSWLTIPDKFHPHITHLSILCDELNCPTSLLSCPHLTHLTFGDSFNQNLSFFSFPPSLSHLTFGKKFNQPLDSLPPSLVHLHIPVESAFDLYRLSLPLSSSTSWQIIQPSCKLTSFLSHSTLHSWLEIQLSNSLSPSFSCWFGIVWNSI